MNTLRIGLLVAIAASTASCWKVPITPVEAGFLQADAAWFEEEQTLFVFYEVEAQQGLGDPSVIEVTWSTDLKSCFYWELGHLSIRKTRHTRK